MRSMRASTLLALPTALAILATLATAAAPLGAQGPLIVRVGVSAGPESMPAALRTSERDPHTQAPGVGGELRLGVGRLGPLSLEGRAGLHSGELRGYEVVNPNAPADYSLSMVWERPDVRPGPQATADVRLRLDLGPEAGPTQAFTLGGGLMTGGVRYVVGSMGHRWGSGGVGVELELAAYEIPWKRTQVFFTSEDPYGEGPFFFDHAVRSSLNRLSLGVGLRLVYSLRLRR